MHRSSTGGRCNSSSLLLYFLGLRRAGVAQLVEHLICNQRVGGSNPSASSAKIFRVRGRFPIDCGRQVPASRRWCESVFWLGKLRGCSAAFSVYFPPCGRVGEWLKPADCKSAAPCGLRRFESSPVHHLVRIARSRCSLRAAGEALKRERMRSRFVFSGTAQRDVSQAPGSTGGSECARKFWKPGGVVKSGEAGLVFLAGSFARCVRQTELAWVAQMVERVLGKDEVTGSIPVPGSRGRGCGLYLNLP